MKWKKLLLLGDSHTQSGWSRGTPWASDLSDLLQRKCDVINRGLYGYNTENVRIIMAQILDEFDSECLCGAIIMLGSNDSSSSVPLHVPTQLYEANLSLMVESLRNLGLDAQRIILVSPPKKDDDAWVEYLRVEWPGEVTDQFDRLVPEYVSAVRKVATETGVQLLDLNHVMEGYGEKYKELLSDGLHLNEQGSHVLFSCLKPLVESSIIPQLRTNFPDYIELKAGQTEILQ
jgi:lysophospholipase L1-like esterase